MVNFWYIAHFISKATNLYGDLMVYPASIVKTEKEHLYGDLMVYPTQSELRPAEDDVTLLLLLLEAGRHGAMAPWPLFPP